MKKDGCPECGNEKSRVAVHCRSCYMKLRHNKEKKGKEMVCGVCGKKFYAYPHEIKAGRKFCGHPCYYEWQKGQPKPKPENFSDTMRAVNPPKGKKIKKRGRGGYVWLYRPEHPNARKAPPDFGYVQEHVMVVANHLGRRIVRGEVIHHLNGLKQDNRIENLVLCESPSEHTTIHQEMQRFVEKLIQQDKVYYEKGKFYFSF